MKNLISFTLVVVFSLMTVAASQAQDSNNFKEQFDRHFNYASRVLQLAKAMPADKYDWRPMDGVMSVEEVYTHIAHYNYLYLVDNLGVELPEGIDMENMESITGKENVVDTLEKSIQFVNSTVEGISESKLAGSTQLYGRTVNGQSVLMQLVTHLSEHVGQSIAYARMNKVIPPWSE